MRHTHVRLRRRDAGLTRVRVVRVVEHELRHRESVRVMHGRNVAHSSRGGGHVRIHELLLRIVRGERGREKPRVERAV